MTIEAATSLPIVPYPDEIEWQLDEYVGLNVPMFGFSVAQRVRYGVARWRAKIRYSKLNYDQRARILAFAARVGRHRPFWVSDWSNDRNGALSAPELLTSPESASYWAASTNRVITTDHAGVRVAKSGATTTSGIGLASTVAVTSGLTYALRGVREHEGSSATISTGLRAGSTQFASDYGSVSSSATGGRQVVRCTPSAATMYVGCADSLTEGSWAVYPWYVLRGMSLCRALAVDGGPGTQRGSGVFVKGGDASQAAALAAGDMVELVSSAYGYSQMLRVVENLNTDSAGKGFLRFEPGLRGLVGDNDLVIPTKPQVRMILSEDPALLTVPPRYVTDLELSCEEVFE